MEYLGDRNRGIGANELHRCYLAFEKFAGLNGHVLDEQCKPITGSGTSLGLSVAGPRNNVASSHKPKIPGASGTKLGYTGR